MVYVEFLGPINKTPIKLKINSLKELAEILNRDESLKEWLKESAIAVNDEIVTNRDFSLKDGDKVSILPPVCGG